MSSETKFTDGPWVFEPHGMFGEAPLDEYDAPWPFGYLSTGASRIPSPIFELSPVLKIDPDRLLANAHLIAAAPVLYEALPDLSHVITWLENGCDPKKAAQELRIYANGIDAAKAKARGES